jgi:CRP/FNR family cyclic AMP-dependent transcriptional regulator
MRSRFPSFEITTERGCPATCEKPDTTLDPHRASDHKCIMSQKLDQFSGPEGKRRLIEVLGSHSIIAGHDALASKIADLVTLEEIANGKTLLKQSAPDNHVYLVISGEFSIEVSGKRVATIGKGSHIGEMAMLDPEGGRSASAVAMRDSIVARITQPNFSALADEYPQLWRRIARELAKRVRLHNLRFASS